MFQTRRWPQAVLDARRFRSSPALYQSHPHREQQGRRKCRCGDHGRQGGKRLTHSEPIKPQTIGGWSQHGAKGK